MNLNETSSRKRSWKSLVESLPMGSNFDINPTGTVLAPLYIHFLAQVAHLRALVHKVHILKTRLSVHLATLWDPHVRRGCRSGASSNFADAISSVISGLMLVSDFWSSKITANHFAVEFLSLLAFPPVFDVAVVPFFMHFVCIGATSMRTCICWESPERREISAN